MKRGRPTLIPPEPSADQNGPVAPPGAQGEGADVATFQLDLAIASFDRRGRCVNCSPDFERILSLKPNDIKELVNRLFETPEERAYLERIVESVSSGGVEPTAYVRRSVGSDEHEIYAVEVIPSRNGEGSEYAVILRDKDSSSQLKQGLEQYDRLAALGQVTAGVAHEFNNILTSVLGWTEIARRKTDAQSPASQALEIIEGNAKRAREIASRLLGMSKPPSESCRSISMVAALEEVMTLMSSELENEKIAVIRSFEGDDTCFGDENRLGQVFINIVRNAMDAMQGGGTLYIGVSNNGEFVEVSFRDTGPGIEPTVLSRIFKPFFTTKVGTNVPRFGGTGLGLSICNEIISEIGGKISVMSTPGKGANFIVSIPVRDRISSVPQGTKNIFDESIAGASLLIVDDEVDIGEMISMSLRFKGLDAEFVQSGEAALLALGKKRFDAALVDFTMPGLSGYDLVRELYAASPDLKIIVMSGREVAPKGDVEIAEFLKKPFDLDEIQLKLVEVLGSPK